MNSPRQSPLLQFRNASFGFPHRPVLDRISLSLQEGESAALIGPNGAGKTTLLRLASGALTTTSGEVRVDGEVPTSIPHRQRARLVAMVPQQLDVPFDFTVQQIVEQGRTPYLGLLRGATREDFHAVDRALDLTDSTHLRDRIFNELSGGERQRVKIALGLAQQAKILLLDEPTQNLDIGRQAEFIDLLHRLQSERITILASIHDLHLVHDNFPTVHLLSPRGSLLTGTPSEILTSANLTEAFHCAAERHPFLTRQTFPEAVR